MKRKVAGVCALLILSLFHLIAQDDELPSHEQMLEAVKQGDIEFVREALNNGYPVDKVAIPTPYNLLVQAAKEGQTEIATMLVEEFNADVNLSSWGETDGFPLYSAAAYGNLEIVKLLVKHGANINAITSTNHENALFMSTIRGHFEVAKFLVEHGADVSIITRNGSGVLTFPVSYGRNELAFFLLDHGAPIDLVDPFGGTILQQTILKQNWEFLDYLFAHREVSPAFINKQDRDGRTALYIAVEQQSLEAVKILVENGADIEVTDSELQFTALHLAVYYRNSEIVEYLLYQGADPNAQALNNRTPLHIAAYYGRIDIADKLLAVGANVEAVDISKNTALVIAVDKNQVEMVNFLIGNGSPVNTLSTKGFTPLTLAVASGNIELVQTLLDAGATVEQPPGANYFPIQVAADKGFTEIARLLETWQQ